VICEESDICALAVGGASVGTLTSSPTLKAVALSSCGSSTGAWLACASATVRNEVGAGGAGTQPGTVDGDLVPSVAATDGDGPVRSRLRLEAAISGGEASERGG
jgi:hypothetical protein